MAIRQLSRYQTFDEPMDDFGSDDVFLQNVIAPPPVAAPAPAPAPYTPPPIAAPVAAPTPYVAPQTFQPRFSIMPEQVYEDFGSDDSFFRDVVAPTPAPPPAWEPLAQQISSQWQQYGINPDIKGINRANELAQILTNYGITDLSKLGLTEATPYQETFEYAGSDIAPPESVVKDYTRRQITYGDKTLGKLGGFGSKGQQEFAAPLEYLGPAYEGSDRYGLAYSAAGKGWVDYEVVPGPGGKPVIVPRWGSTSDITPELLSVLAFAAAPFTGGLSTALGGGLAGQIGAHALTSAGFGALNAAAQGEDILKSALRSGVGGALSAGIGSLVTPAANAVSSSVLDATKSQVLADIASGAIKGGAGALPGAIMSGDFGNVLTGAVSGGVGSGVSSGLENVKFSDTSSVNNAIIQGAGDIAAAATKAAVTGQKFDVASALTPAIAQGIAEEYKLPVKQVTAGLQVASKLLQGGELSPADILKLGTSLSSSGTKPTAGQAASAGYGGAETEGFFDSEEAQNVEDDIQSILARYPEAAPTPQQVEVSAPVPAPTVQDFIDQIAQEEEVYAIPQYEPAPITPPPPPPPPPPEQVYEVAAPAPAPTIQDFIDQITREEEVYAIPEAVVPTPAPAPEQRYEVAAPAPAPYFPEFEEPFPVYSPEPAQRVDVTGTRDVPIEQTAFEQFMQQYAQPIEPPGMIEGPSTIEVPGTRLPPTIEPIYEQPPTPAPEPIYEQPPTPAPTPAAPAPTPSAPAAPAPAPAPPKQQGPSLAELMMTMGLLGKMSEPQEAEREVIFNAPAINLDTLFGYREPTSLKELLAMTGQRPRG